MANHEGQRPRAGQSGKPRAGRVRLRPNRGFPRHPALRRHPPRMGSNQCRLPVGEKDASFGFHDRCPRRSPIGSVFDRTVSAVSRWLVTRDNVPGQGKAESPGAGRVRLRPNRGFPRYPALRRHPHAWEVPVSVASRQSGKRVTSFGFRDRPGSSIVSGFDRTNVRGDRFGPLIHEGVTSQGGAKRKAPAQAELRPTCPGASWEVASVSCRLSVGRRLRFFGFRDGDRPGSLIVQMSAVTGSDH
jgi:hypothetical protein